MSFLKKMMAGVGIGAAKVNTVLENRRVRPGDEVRGRVNIVGGSIEQQVDRVYLDLMTYYIKEGENDTKIRQNARICQIHVYDSFTIAPNESKSIDFSFIVPFETPMTFGNNSVWLETGLDVKMAIDPSDKDYLDVLPHPYVQNVLEAMESELGFRLYHFENEYHPRYGAHLPFVQEFEFRPQGSFRSRLEEVELIFKINYNGLEILMELDRRARGLRGLLMEAADMDETCVRFFLTAEELEMGSGLIAERINDIICRYI